VRYYISIVFITSLCCPVAAQDLSVSDTGKNDKNTENISITDQIEKYTEKAMDIAPSESPEKLPVQNFPDNPDEIYRLKEERLPGYIATIDIMDLTHEGKGAGKLDNNSLAAVVGLRRPYYKLGKDLRLAGSVDLKINRGIAGTLGGALITLGYDFRKNRYDPSIKTEFKILECSIKFSFPF